MWFEVLGSHCRIGLKAAAAEDDNRGCDRVRAVGPAGLNSLYPLTVSVQCCDRGAITQLDTALVHHLSHSLKLSRATTFRIDAVPRLEVVVAIDLHLQV